MDRMNTTKNSYSSVKVRLFQPSLCEDWTWLSKWRQTSRDIDNIFKRFYVSKSPPIWKSSTL